MCRAVSHRRRPLSAQITEVGKAATGVAARLGSGPPRPCPGAPVAVTGWRWPGGGGRPVAVPVRWRGRRRAAAPVSALIDAPCALRFLRYQSRDSFFTAGTSLGRSNMSLYFTLPIHSALHFPFFNLIDIIVIIIIIIMAVALGVARNFFFYYLKKKKRNSFSSVDGIDFNFWVGLASFGCR